MHRTSMHLSAIALLAAAATAGAVVTIPAHADTPTCDGKAATIVGPGPNNVIEGTPGDDVIVSPAEGSLGAIYTYEGDDTVCIVPGTAPIPEEPRERMMFVIHTGPGNDKVFNQEPRPATSLEIVLGLGSDIFVGNDRGEHVRAGALDPGALHDQDDAEDTITTAGGRDTIYTGTPGSVNADVVATGLGHDRILHAGTGTTLDNGVEAGRGDHLILLQGQWNQRPVAVDNRTGTATVDTGEILRWNNVTVFAVPGDSPLRFTGSDGPEMLYVSSSLPLAERSKVNVDARMNGGDDRLWFWGGVVPGRVSGGKGDDMLTPDYQSACTRTTVVLNASLGCTVTTAGSTVTHDVALAGWERYDLFTARRHAIVTGTKGRDEIQVSAPRVTARGLGGNDTIEAITTARAVLRGDGGADRLTGGDGKDTVFGGHGNDTILGGSGDDRLIGGGGHDTAKGNAGKDYCRADVRRSCER